MALFLLPKHRGTGVGRRLRAIPLTLSYDYIWGQHFEDLGNLQNWVNFGRKHLFTYKDMGGGNIHITVMDMKPEGKTAGEITTFYHGTTWDAADQIQQTGLKASPWTVKGKSGKYVWCSTLYDQAAEYGMSAGWDIGSEPGKYAVVTFKWDFDDTEPDPEHNELSWTGDIYRRIPGDVPKSAIAKIDYYAEENGDIVKSITASKTADKVLDVGEGDEYWAGEGNAASGVLPVCPQTGNVCLAWRSNEVMMGNCWGTIGGAVQKGMSPQRVPSPRCRRKQDTTAA